eukprot:13461746-Alexandrium_andersonii.AAC.1
MGAFTPRGYFPPETVPSNRLNSAAPESRAVVEIQACRRLGPKGRSLPEHFYWRHCDWSCKPENRGTTGWPV